MHLYGIHHRYWRLHNWKSQRLNQSCCQIWRQVCRCHAADKMWDKPWAVSTGPGKWAGWGVKINVGVDIDISLAFTRAYGGSADPRCMARQCHHTQHPFTVLLTGISRAKLPFDVWPENPINWPWNASRALLNLTVIGKSIDTKSAIKDVLKYCVIRGGSEISQYEAYVEGGQDHPPLFSVKPYTTVTSFMMHYWVVGVGAWRFVLELNKQLCIWIHLKHGGEEGEGVSYMGERLSAPTWSALLMSLAGRIV